MGLNKSKGNMYEFITDTWNVVKGKCYHDCSYCYMKQWGEQKPIRFDKSELKTDLGKGNFIFVGSSTDMFAPDISKKWINKVLFHCFDFSENKYLLQTKNPYRYLDFFLPENFILGCTIETNRHYKGIMGNTHSPFNRALAMKELRANKKFVTIEPIIDFDLKEMLEIINITNPQWVNIGADSKNHNLPEPSKDKIDELIKRIDSKITIKKNMKRFDSKDK